MATSSEISNRMRECTAEYNELFTEKTKIASLLTRVIDAKSELYAIEAVTSFKWIRDNMKTYWNAAESGARNDIEALLNTVITEISDDGKISSEISKVTDAATQKIEELSKKMDEITRKIEQLTVELKEALAAETAEITE